MSNCLSWEGYMPTWYLQLEAGHYNYSLQTYFAFQSWWSQLALRDFPPHYFNIHSLIDIFHCWFMLNRPATHSMLTSTVLWQVCSWPRWYLFKLWHHDMRHASAGRFDRQPSCRWVKLLGQPMAGDETHQVLWKISDILVGSVSLMHTYFPKCKKLKVMKFLIFFEICHVVLLQSSSMLSGAEKLNSTGLQGHDSLFPLTLCPNYSLHFYFPGVDGLWLHGRSWHYLLSI